MKSRLPWLLLAASMAFNLFFAGGMIFSRVAVEPQREERPSRWAFSTEGLGLADDERQGLEALRTAIQERRRQLREDLAPYHLPIVEEMRKPAFDGERVRGILGERSKLYVAFLSDVMTRTHDYSGGLSEGKRDEVLSLMERKLFRGPGSRRDKSAQP